MQLKHSYNNESALRKLNRNSRIIGLIYQADVFDMGDCFIDDGISAALQYSSLIVNAYQEKEMPVIKEQVKKLIGLLSYIKMPRLNECVKKVFQTIEKSNDPFKNIEQEIRILRKETILAEMLYKKINGIAGNTARLLSRHYN